MPDGEGTPQVCDHSRLTADGGRRRKGPVIWRRMRLVCITNSDDENGIVEVSQSGSATEHDDKN